MLLQLLLNQLLDRVPWWKLVSLAWGGLGRIGLDGLVLSILVVLISLCWGSVRLKDVSKIGRLRLANSLSPLFNALDVLAIPSCLGGSRFLSLLLRGIFNGLLRLFLLGLLDILLLLFCSNLSRVHFSGRLDGDMQLEITLEFLLSYFIGG